MKLIENLPYHLKEEKDYLLKLKESIDIPIDCIKCRKYRHHAMECGKGEKVEKGKNKKEKKNHEQDGVDIKLVILQDLMTVAKIVEQEIKEIKEDNSTDIEEQNIVELANLKYFPRPLTDSPVTGIIMIDPPDPPTDKEVTDINVSNNNKIDSNRQNSLNSNDRVIFQNRVYILF